MNCMRTERIHKLNSKAMKSNFSILLTVAIVLFFSSCDIIDKASEPTVDSFPSCQDLLSQIDEEHYIIELQDGAVPDAFMTQAGAKTKLEGRIIKELKDLLNTGNTMPQIVVKDKIAKTCMCQTILMKVDPNINASDRTADAQSRLKQQDDNGNPNKFFKQIDYNYNFPIGPIEKLSQKRPGELNDDIPSGIGSPDKDVIIAVIDSGVDYLHESITNYLWSNGQESLINNTDNDGNCLIDDYLGYNFIGGNNKVIDYLGHGTHVAGIIVNGFRNNSSQKIKTFSECIGLMNLKILEKDTTSLFAAVCAINYAVDKEVDIINASWGYYAHQKSELLEAAIKRAASKKIFIVAAAGNHNQNIDECKHWPASFSSTYKNVISVAANDDNGMIADFSNYGKNNVNFSAIGTDIVSAFPFNDQKSLNGTSMSAPIVTRYIAWQKCEGKTYSEIIKNLTTFGGAPINSSNKLIKRNIELKPTPPY